jgi:hypothetical protein
MIDWRVATLASTLVSAVSAPVLAYQDQPLVGLHESVRVGNKICFKDHFHFGSSTGEPSRKAAEAAAIRTWQSFTGWEYGRHWGRFAMAENKRISCSGSAGSFACNVEARPCRPR